MGLKALKWPNDYITDVASDTEERAGAELIDFPGLPEDYSDRKLLKWDTENSKVIAVDPTLSATVLWEIL